MFIQDQRGALLLAKEEGREENKIHTAIKLLDLMDEATIAQITELPLTKVRELKQQHKSK